ncbi:MAG: nucleotidyltransferase family protein [Aquificaceae bacterium]
MEKTKQVISSHIKEIKKRFAVKNIGVFTLGDNLYVLVEFLTRRLNFDNYMDLKFYLEDLIGKRVSLVTRGSIKPIYRDLIFERVEYIGQ